MRFAEFFDLYNQGDFIHNAFGNSITTKLQVVDHEIDKIDVNLEVISIFTRRERKIGTTYLWASNKVLNYKCKQFFNEAACLYDFFSAYQKKANKTNAFYPYETIYATKDTEGGAPVGVVIALPAPKEKSDETFIEANDNEIKYSYKFYFLDDLLYDLEDKTMDEAIEHVYHLLNSYTNDVNKFIKESKWENVYPSTEGGRKCTSKN